jgi:hypothetical protein
MRSEAVGRAPAPGVEEVAGAAGAGVGAPAAGLGQAPRAGGMSPEIKTKWWEFAERENRKYVIEIVDASVEEDTVVYSRMRLERIYFPIYPYGNYVKTLYEIEWNSADCISVSAKIVRDGWNGTGSESIGNVIVEVALPEAPWFFNYYDLEETIERHRVKKTMEWILSSIKAMAIDILGGGE